MPGWIPFDVGFSDLSRMNANRCKIRRVLVKRTRSRRARRIRKKPKCVWHVNHDNVAMVALASARQQMTDIRWKHRFPRFARNDEAPLRVGDAATCLRRFRTKSICVPIGHWPLLSARTLPSFVCFGFCWLCCRVFNGIANARTSEKKKNTKRNAMKKGTSCFYYFTNRCKMNENGVRSDVMLNHTWNIACGKNVFASTKRAVPCSMRMELLFKMHFHAIAFLFILFSLVAAIAHCPLPTYR